MSAVCVCPCVCVCVCVRERQRTRLLFSAISAWVVYNLAHKSLEERKPSAVT